MDRFLWAGAAQVEITPPLGTELSGNFDAVAATTVQRPLYATALALRSAATTVVLVSCDVLMMRAVDVVDPAKAGIAARTGIAADHVLVSATHTHAGPATVDLGVSVPDPAWLTRLVAAIVEAAVTAVDRLVPAQLGYGQAPVAGVCFNRRHLRRDGLVEFNPGPGRTDLVGPAGPVDPTVTSLIVEDLDGTPLAVWANLAVHHVGTGSRSAISSDYFGACAEQVAALLGPGVVTQVTNGCSGDINNIDLSGAQPTTGARRAWTVGTAVAGAAMAGTLMAPRDRDVEITAETVDVELERVPVTEADLTIAREVLAGNRTDAPFSYVRGMAIPVSLVHWHADQLTKLATLPERATVRASIVTIGDLCLVGLPGEMFVELGLAIRAASRFPVTAVIGLANDHVGYVPTARGFAEGGYETWRNQVSWTAPGSGERLVAAVVARLSGPSRRSTAGPTSGAAGTPPAPHPARPRPR